MISISLPNNLVQVSAGATYKVYSGCFPVWKLTSICTSGDRVTYAVGSTTLRSFTVPNGTIVINCYSYDIYRPVSNIGIWSYTTNSIELDGGLYKTLESTANYVDLVRNSRYAIADNVDDSTLISDLMANSFVVSSTMREILSRFDSGFRTAGTIYGGFNADGDSFTDETISAISPINWTYETPWVRGFNFSGDALAGIFAYLSSYQPDEGYPITYMPIHSILEGPDKAPAGSAVEVNVSFPEGYKLKNATQGSGISVYDEHGYIDFAYDDATGKLTFTMPTP